LTVYWSESCGLSAAHCICPRALVVDSSLQHDDAAVFNPQLASGSLPVKVVVVVVVFLLCTALSRVVAVVDGVVLFYQMTKNALAVSSRPAATRQQPMSKVATYRVAVGVDEKCY